MSKIKRDDTMLDVKLIENPRMNLNEALLPTLTAIARNAFGTHMGDGDVAAHVLDVDRIYLIKRSDEIVGFSSYNSNNEELYLSGIVLRRDAQRKGIFSEMNGRALADTMPKYFVMRTQNPVIYGATKTLVRNIYPGLSAAPKHIGEIAQKYGGASMGEDFVIRGCYGTSLYDKIPEHSAKKFFDNVLKMDYGRGDAVIIVGEV
jgi:hypothetical protein